MKRHTSRNQSTESGYGISFGPLVHNSQLFKGSNPGGAAGRPAPKKKNIGQNQATLEDYSKLNKFINEYNKIPVGTKENLAFQEQLLNNIMEILNKELDQLLEENEEAKRLRNDLIGEVREELKDIHSELKVDVRLPAIN